MHQSLAHLQRRSELLAALRLFFFEHDFVEVETPLLAPEVIPELHIDPIAVEAAWLQASPELHMKRLVAAGMPAIFQITRSFRAGERGALHNPEFTIVEWYRTGDDMHAGMKLLDQLCQAILNTPVASQTTYGAAFSQHAGICPHTSSADQLATRAKELRLDIPDNMQVDDRDEWLNLLLATQVEPRLGQTAPEIVYDYPASQAALAKVERREDGIKVARRFELYASGIELANGYDELTDAAELRLRLTQVNAARQAEGRPALPLPESLLEAMQQGLPNCSGCALGFDRLAMLALGTDTIAEARAFY
ncbi:MAG: EF-P lysine aminoacylase GenX [Planctomycetes bacterium]|nr:EF-P lysine aminoacylase GenX [Planctomycetota bacterium]